MNKISSTPRFTVIIPTKDRADYLIHTLRTCSIQDYENLEIIVSDDGSQDNTREVVEDFAKKDNRIRYISPGADAGMRMNFEFALSQVKPGYVMAIGGDDGLLPYGISGMNEVLQESGKELLTWPSSTYFYPNVRAQTSQLVLFANHGKFKNNVKIVNSKDYLARQAKNLSYLADEETPMFYCKGVVSTNLVDRVRARSMHNYFYSCSTPDGYSGIVLAGEVEDYAFSYKPFSLLGASPTSQGSVYMGFNPKHKKQADDFFKKSLEIPMHKELGSEPYSPLLTLMTADFLLTARDLPGWPGSFPQIDYRNLIVKSLKELNGLWADEKIGRELNILLRISRFHGLEDFFLEEISRLRRDKRRPLNGSAISPSRIYLDGDKFGIKNIFDAVYVSHYMNGILSNINKGYIVSVINNSIRYWVQSKSRGKKFNVKDLI